MNTVPARAPQTTALVDWLAGQTAIAVGRGEKPPGVGWAGVPGQSIFVPYYVLHPVPGGGLDGPLGDPHADAELIWQLNSHGGTQQQAETAADLARAALLLAGLPPLDIEGRRVVGVASEIVAGAARQDIDQPSIWWCFEQYRIRTTPT